MCLSRVILFWGFGSFEREEFSPSGCALQLLPVCGALVGETAPSFLDLGFFVLMAVNQRLAFREKCISVHVHGEIFLQPCSFTRFGDVAIFLAA